MRAWWLVALLILPSGAAQTLEWMGPDAGVVDAPVFMAYRMDDGDGGYAGHVNVQFTVEMNGHTLFSTEQLHEHEGFHTFVFTPPAAGELVFTAVAAGVESTRTVTVEASKAERDGWPEAGFKRGENVAGTQSSSMGAQAVRTTGTTGWALVEGRDAAGTTRFSSWQHAMSGGSYLSKEPWSVLGAFTDNPIRPLGKGATLVDGGSWEPADDNGQPFLLPGLPRPPSCADAGVDVTLDPNSVSPAGNPQFQEHAAIRVALPNGASGDIVYFLTEVMTEISMRTVMTVTAVDPFSQAILAPDGPGSMRLLVRNYSDGDAGIYCTVFFDVTPNPAEPGSVDVNVDVDGAGVDVTLTPYDSMGAIIGHYEFDTRVMLLSNDDTAGRLVYQGKLHGHSGVTSFRLDNLEPGTYRLWTHPSPQDPAAPPVLPATNEGFVEVFEVAEPARGEAVYVFSKEPEVQQEKSTPAIGLPLLLLLGTLMRLRRT